MVKKSPCILLIVTNVAMANNIDLYTVKQIPFYENKRVVCYIDDSQNLINDTNEKLGRIPPNEIDALINVELMQKIENATLCRAKAAAQNISKVPAIVINDKYVVYGERNIHKALSLVPGLKND